MSRYRLTFTVDLIGEHERASEAEAIEHSRRLYEAYREAMRSIPAPGLLLPVTIIAPHPYTGKLEED